MAGAALLATKAEAAPQTRHRPPPPTALIVDCMPGPWIVFFGDGNVRLDAFSKIILDRMLETRRLCGPFDLDVVGHRDGAEPVEASRRRAEAVRSQLLAHGMRPAEIHVTDEGDRKPRIASDGRTPEPQNRRVELFPRPSRSPDVP